MDLIKEYLELIEDFDLCTLSYIEFATKAKNIAEKYHYLQLQQAGVITNEMEVCDCEIPKPIDPYHEIDKQVCRDCSGYISQT